MKRKIVAQGAGGHTISLPIDWIRLNKIKVGGSVDVIQQGHDLLIANDFSGLSKEIKFEISSNSETYIRLLLSNAYRSGYSKIFINGNVSKKIIAKIVNDYLLGFEMSGISPNYLIESVNEPDLLKFNNLLIKQLFMLSEIVINISDDIENIVFRIQKYDNFLKRCLSSNKIEISNKFVMWQFLSNITYSARAFYHFKKDVKNITQTNEIEKLKEMINIIKKSYLTNDYLILDKLHNIEKNILMNKDITNKENYHIKTIARLLYFCSSPLVSIILNKKFDI